MGREGNFIDFRTEKVRGQDEFIISFITPEHNANSQSVIREFFQGVKIPFVSLEIAKKGKFKKKSKIVFPPGTLHITCQYSVFKNAIKVKKRKTGSSELSHDQVV